MTVIETLLSAIILLGPGILATAAPGVLEGVCERRVRWGFGLANNVNCKTDQVLIAPADCNLLGATGRLYTTNDNYTRDQRSVLIVDCEASHHAGQMAERGLLADVNDQNLNRSRAWLVLYPEVVR